ncbi:MAG: response regulator, partial [Candidatus Omnitrophica bacterium]|nr:response regulator [Candidatus Omnitrophota bacterium]
PDIRMTLEYTLGKAGFQITAVKTGDEGLHKCFSERPRVVLSEVKFADMTGYDLCGRIKGNPITRQTTRFIVMTAHPESEVFLRGPEACADYFVGKPFDTAALAGDLHLLMTEDFHLSPEKASLLRVAKRIPTHKESITPGYSSGNKKAVRLTPPVVRSGQRLERNPQHSGASDSHRSATTSHVKDERVAQVDALLMSLVECLRQTRDRITLVSQYLDRRSGQNPPSRN